MKPTLVLFASLLSLCQASRAADPPPWPAAEKAQAIAGCRLSIIDNAERDYLKRHNLTEPPPNFRETIAPAIEPFLATCNCLFDHLEKRWTYEYFVSHQDEAPPIVNELMKSECAAKASSRSESAEPVQ